jgi:hypothetical protein
MRRINGRRRQGPTGHASAISGLILLIAAGAIFGLRLDFVNTKCLETTGLAAINALRPRLGTQEQFRIPTSDSLDTPGQVTPHFFE